MYTQAWWYWNEAGQSMWRQCVKKGKGSDFWKQNQCGTRRKASRWSRWWWWSDAGRATWARCQKEGKGSDYWKNNYCGRARYLFAPNPHSIFLPLRCTSAPLFISDPQTHISPLPRPFHFHDPLGPRSPLLSRWLARWKLCWGQESNCLAHTCEQWVVPHLDFQNQLFLK